MTIFQITIIYKTYYHYTNDNVKIYVTYSTKRGSALGRSLYFPVELLCSIFGQEKAIYLKCNLNILILLIISQLETKPSYPIVQKSFGYVNSVN